MRAFGTLVLRACAVLGALPLITAASPQEGMTPTHVASLRSVGTVELSPDGTLVAYTLSVPRIPGVDDDGSAWSELYVVPYAGGTPQPYVYGEVNVSGARFTPDGKWITYTAKRAGDEKTALWAVPIGGGESRRLLEAESGLGSYHLSPDGTRVAYIATAPESEARKNAKKKGFGQIVFEEDDLPRRLWIASLPAFEPAAPTPWNGETKAEEEDEGPAALEIEGSVSAFAWFDDGARLAVSVTPRPLVDDGYMLNRVRVVDAKTGATLGKIENPGKLGPVVPSPDGRQVALIAGIDYHDPSQGRLMTAPATGGVPKDAMPQFQGHVRSIAWQDAKTVMFQADFGTGTVIGELDVATGKTKTHYLGGTFDVPEGPILAGLSLSQDGKKAAFRGSTPRHPNELFVMAHGDAAPRRVTDSNPWLANVKLARQEVVRHEARDGLVLEGILVHPLGTQTPGAAPLILAVHGGPEANSKHGWVTSYSGPGQVAAARGYAVFYPNYRGSTGRGVEFSKMGQGDPAGKEFDDLIDAVDHLVAIGVADRDRVGVTGGSYGGYATGWLSTYYSDRIRAGVMFVGVSNYVTKGLTTDISEEIRAVHSIFSPWEEWQLRLERSPVYHAEKSRTALLIAGGTGDTRVNAEQSLQLYRILEMLGKTPVRYVKYPGEPHGNRRAAARYDYNLRMMRWFDHYLMGEGGDPPDWDLKLGQDPEAAEGEGDN